METTTKQNAPERTIEEIIKELRASVKDKLPGANEFQTTEIIHELVAGGIK